MGMLILGFLPSITAPKGPAATFPSEEHSKSTITKVLYKNAGVFVQGRARCARKWGLSTEDISRAETTIIFAAVTNTVRNVFYMLCYSFSDELVAAIREETGKIVTRKCSDGVESVLLNTAMLRLHCPLLTGSYYETLRLTKTGASVRTTLSDVMLDNEYLLKKGAVIQIPTGVLQSDPNTWGNDAKAFNPRASQRKSRFQKKLRRRRLRHLSPLVGGKNLCPGRHLAFTEITAFVAMMVYGFELMSGEWWWGPQDTGTGSPEIWPWFCNPKEGVGRFDSKEGGI